jgi:hypothetical protein
MVASQPTGGQSARWANHRGLGFGLAVAVAVGADTTDWRYWAIELVVGALVIVFAAARSQWPLHATLALAIGLLTAAVGFGFGRLA